MSGEQNTARTRGSMKRILVIGLAIFGLILAGLIVAVWVAGDSAPLPFQYEGFD